MYEFSSADGDPKEKERGIPKLMNLALIIDVKTESVDGN